MCIRDSYWNESAFYSFTRREIDELENATNKLYKMFLEAGQYVIDNNKFDLFGIQQWCVPLIKEAWDSEPPALNYGRFDLGFDGNGPPKLFEFNCDTPTSLLEAAVIQWFWKEDQFPRKNQFNNIHEDLIAKWKDISPYLGSKVVHFAHFADTAGEDIITTAYMMDLAREAGLLPEHLLMHDIGWQQVRTGELGKFVDLNQAEIATLYKLYPWEWMVAEPFGKNLLHNFGRTNWIEPIWKMIWSNKAILAILWEMFPNHPYLLRAGFEEPKSGIYVRKPLLAREGANVSIRQDGQDLAALDGPYQGPYIYQSYCALPNFNENIPVVGSWCVDGFACGIGIREDGPITSNLARFVPHIIDG